MKKQVLAMSAFSSILLMSLSPAVLADEVSDAVGFINSQSELASKEDLAKVLNERAEAINSKEVSSEAKILGIALLQKKLKIANIDLFLKSSGQEISVLLKLKKAILERANVSDIALTKVVSEQADFYEENPLLRSIKEQAVGAKYETSEDARKLAETVSKEVQSLQSCQIASEAEAKSYIDRINGVKSETSEGDSKISLSKEELEKVNLTEEIEVTIKSLDADGNDVEEKLAIKAIEIKVNKELKDRELAKDLEEMSAQDEVLSLKPGNEFLKEYGLEQLIGDSQVEKSISKEDAQKVRDLMSALHGKAVAVAESQQAPAGEKSTKEILEEFKTNFTCKKEESK